MSIDDYIYTYPQLWEEAGKDKTKFIRLLYDYRLVTLDEWGELFDTVTHRFVRPTPEPDVKLTAKQRIGVMLWNKISDFFVMMWQDWAANVVSYTDKIYAIIEELLQRTIGGVVDAYLKTMYSMVTVKPEDPPFIRQVLKEFLDKPTLMGFIWFWLYRLGYWIGFGTSVIGIVGKDAVRALNKEYSPALPDISTLITHYYKTPEDRELVYSKAAEQGFEKSEVDVYVKSMETLLSPDDLRNLFLRGKIDDETLRIHMHRAGWTDAGIDKLKELFFMIPGPSDQIRFAVREAFDEDYIKEFDTMKDFPEGFAAEAQKVGVNRFWAEKFWAAHWELPPLTAAYEMLHRDVINPEHLAQLFKAQDVMPWWRDKLEAISYNPLTRVDVRRMYKTGTLDRDGVKRAYLDVGYNEKNADLMTDFTIKWASEAERDLTKADILGAYQRKLISLEDTRNGLNSLGYDNDEAEILISRIDYEVAKKKKAAVLKNLQKGYKKGVYDSSHIQSRMQELNMPGAEITELVNLWAVETKDDTEPLSKADLSAMFKKKIIPEDVYRDRLTKLNYVKQDIEWLVKLNK